MRFCIAIGASLVPTTPVALGGDFVDRMEVAHRIGYDGVELHSPSASLIDVAAVKKEMQTTGLKVETIGTGPIWGKFGLSIMDPDPVRLSTLVDMVRTYINVASELGSKITIGSIKGNVPAGETKEHALERVMPTYQLLDDMAGKKGVHILLEATNRYENNYFNSGKDVYDFIEQAGLKHTQLLLDSFHANIEEADVQHCVKPLMKHLGHLHFADNNRHYPGAGCFDFDAYCKQIQASGYDGVLSIECLPWPDSLSAATNAYHFFESRFTR